MDLGDWVKLARDEAVGYGSWFINALLHPAYVGRQAAAWAAEPPKAPNEAEESRPVPAPLITVLIISIFVGATIGAIIPGRPPMKDRATVAVVVLLLWILVSVTVHAIIRVLGGKGSVGATLLAMLQVLALGYVLSNMLTLLVISALTSLTSDSPSDLPVRPGTLLLGLQFVIALIYLPFSLHKVHGLAAFRGLGIFVTFLAASIAFVVGALALAAGGC